MKRYSLIAGVTAIAAGLLIAVASTTTAQSTDSKRATNRQDRLANRTSTSRLDSKTKGANLRASQIIGMNIYNANEESVGKVNDIVLDAENGKVRYAAVTYGGFLGIGDKMFAVPWEAFKCQQQKDDPNDHYLMLNISQSQLKGAEGFDQDNWPNFADRNFTDLVDKRYGVKRDRNGNVDVDVHRNGVDVDVDRRNRNN